MSRPDLSRIPLRERKRAQTRLALTEALIERLAERTLEDVQISELAEAAGVSPATVHNYFGGKGDILTHFIQLWSLKVSALARAVRAESDSALAAIEALLVSTAEDAAPAPKLMLEIIAHQARMPAEPDLEHVELAERLLFLPDEDDVESLSDEGLGGVLPALLAEAVAEGELPQRTDVQALVIALFSIFMGVPLLLANRQPDAIAPVYRQQLALLWAGARALTPEVPS